MAQGKLLIQRCPQCGEHQFYHRLHCLSCGHVGPEPVVSSGIGTVYSFTVLRVTEEPTPPIIALVELAEGVRLLSRIADAQPDEVRIGMSVTLETAVGDGPDALPVPVFRSAVRG